MRILTWQKINNLKPSEAADLLEISRSAFYKYSYEDVMPEQVNMLKIAAKTGGLVTANDIVGTTPQFITKVLKEPYFLHEVLRNPQILKEVFKE